MPGIVLAKRAHAQIAQVLVYTLKEFGPLKRDEYHQLIHFALEALAEDAEAGTKKPQIHPDAWTYPIGRPGRRARHVFLYRIRVDVEIGGFLYDGMDLVRRWPKEWRTR